MSTSVEVNSDLEFTTVNHGTQDNGSSLIEELSPLELTTEDPMPSPTREVKGSLEIELVASENGKVKPSRELPTMVEITETSETSQDNVLMFMEVKIPTIDTLSGGIATMDLTKHGPLN